MATSKTKTAFFCNNCGYESAKWLGKCPACNQWNTFVQEIVHKEEKEADAKAIWQTTESKKSAKIVHINDIDTQEQPRMETPDEEFNRVLGGGIVPGSIVLVAGEPGIGKSTLFLQLGLLMSDKRVLYISGEESGKQVKMRADRLNIRHEDFYLLSETNTQKLFAEIKALQPEILIVDSIQTLESPFIESGAGSVSQIKQTAGELQKFAKETNTPVFLIGHITKDGSIAGPKVLEHMVDTVLQFEGDRHYNYRLLRTQKNRFGSTNELGIYDMHGAGLKPVLNPSEILIGQKDEALGGSAIAACIEGMRPLLLEVQALVTQSVYGTPQRTVSGYDSRRLQLLLAVLEKRGGFMFASKDVFVNIAGGLKIEDPSLDLAVVMALLSSYEDAPVNHKFCFAGEIGLSGEIRAVNRIEQRIMEASKLGFEKFFISKYNASLMLRDLPMEVVRVGKVEDIYRLVF
ncbi:DNA repair protein RadA [Polluticaenibacter yanchengensis]|uniref:DNA repair protein RadA n=1 Tax=Polluticaenibacter yanchengensis TaxID=3014562 RepID=A0ABT4UP33_9BACT|nr:DNA repair protein RadA [Chitinophagaceae bacterium LY-5]